VTPSPDRKKKKGAPKVSDTISIGDSSSDPSATSSSDDEDDNGKPKAVSNEIILTAPEFLKFRTSHGFLCDCGTNINKHKTPRSSHCPMRDAVLENAAQRTGKDVEEIRAKRKADAQASLIIVLERIKSLSVSSRCLL
jgi:adenine-specific DNA glycosylase